MITINSKTDVLIVVDMQNDFCPGGALGVTGGDDIVPLVNDYMQHFTVVVASQDWHTPDHISFQQWPNHCVQGTPGADFHPLLAVKSITHIVRKAHLQSKDAYSAFEGTGLAGLLRNLRATRVFLVGLATDYCVKATALSARKAGFQVYVLIDACRAVNIEPSDDEKAREEMRGAGVFLLKKKDLL